MEYRIELNVLEGRGHPMDWNSLGSMKYASKLHTVHTNQGSDRLPWQLERGSDTLDFTIKKN